MKVYVAGPITGYPHFNFPAFADATRLLRNAGHEVCNPCEHDIEVYGPEFLQASHDDDASKIVELGFDLHEAMTYDLGYIINEADCVVVLDGWENSTGARTEVHMAQTIGKPVYTFLTMQEITEQVKTVIS